MKIAGMLAVEMAKSDKFTSENFGLKVGDTYPEMVRELIEEKKVQVLLMKHYLTQQLMGKQILDKVTPGDFFSLAKVPEIFDLPMSMLFWGVEIGRQLEREQAAALQSTGEAKRP